MLVTAYDDFVVRTDLTKGEKAESREDIGIYGLVGELGALTSAVKRRRIAESDGAAWNSPTDEIREEIGDSLWYFSFLAALYDGGSPPILQYDLDNLREQLQGSSKDEKIFQDALGPERVAKFLSDSKTPLNPASLTWDEYQVLAITTARTDGQVFLGVCLTVLAQLGAELLRRRFPEVEKQLNKMMPPRGIQVILGEIAWHLSAVAHIFGLSLGALATENTSKINSRVDRTSRTALHDKKNPGHEQFPRKFKISFVTVADGRSRMYRNGRRLGDELTDNFYEDDGYRFHDVMHLANAAYLGWSPVLRSLLGAKRKSQPKKDEVEDGARARIVEEAIIKAIHCEGVRIARSRIRAAKGRPVRLFESENEVTFQFLKFIRTIIDKLEVEKNRDWEWEQAIVEGNRIYYELRREGQGTVEVDLLKPEMIFRPEVIVDVPGAVVGMGACAVDAALYAPADIGRRRAEDFAWEKAALTGANYLPAEIALRVAAKRAVLQSMGIKIDRNACSAVKVVHLPEGISVKATGDLRKRMWAKKILGFRLAWHESDGVITASVAAITDPSDAAN